MSILLSTRQNNWLSTPQKEKHMSFQLQKNNTIKYNSNNKKNATMAKIKNKSDNRDSDKKKKGQEEQWHSTLSIYSRRMAKGCCYADN